jgi:hypothetical protein
VARQWLGAGLINPGTSTVKAKTVVRVRVRADGPTKVLELTEEHNNSDNSDGLLDDSTRWRRRVKARRTQKTRVTAYLRRLGLSLVDDKPQETLYGCLDHIQVVAAITHEHNTVRPRACLTVSIPLSVSLLPLPECRYEYSGGMLFHRDSNTIIVRCHEWPLVYATPRSDASCSAHSPGVRDGELAASGQPAHPLL